MAPPPRAAGHNKSKPKWVFHTGRGANIIVQSKTARLSLDQQIAAIQEALEQVEANHVAEV